MTTSSKRTALLSTGIVVLIVGLFVGFGLWYSAGQREDDAVRNLARAPSGCDTTLSFDAPGDYYVYVETAGRFDDDIDGDCGADGEYEIAGGVLPAVSLSLTRAGGDEVPLDSQAGVSYDAAGFTGQSVRTFSVEEAGDFQFRVEAPGSPDVQFAAAVGRNPADGVASMRWGGVLSALAGVVLGGGLILAARRTPNVAPNSAEPMWPSQPAGWPTSPPGMPTAPPPPGQAPVGPPTQYPPTHSPPTQYPPAQQLPPAPSAPGWNPDGSAWGASSSDGSSGDGQRSPWAPPDSTHQ